MDKDRYTRILKFAACLAALAMLWISAQFSVNGFNIIVPEQEYIGWILAGVIIIVELVWNKVGDRAGMTLFFAGIICYLYGIYTNVTGVMASSDLVNAQGTREVIAASILGIFLEVVPEPLFIWGLIGATSDPIANLLGSSKNIQNTHKEGHQSQTSPYKPSGNSRFVRRNSDVEAFLESKRVRK